MNNQFKIMEIENDCPISKKKHLLLLKLKELSDKAISVDLIDNFNKTRKDTDVMGLKFENKNDTIIYFWDVSIQKSLSYKLVIFRTYFVVLKIIKPIFITS